MWFDSIQFSYIHFENSTTKYFALADSLGSTPLLLSLVTTVLECPENSWNVLECPGILNQHIRITSLKQSQLGS